MKTFEEKTYHQASAAIIPTSAYFGREDWIYKAFVFSTAGKAANTYRFDTLSCTICLAQTLLTVRTNVSSSAALVYDSIGYILNKERELYSTGYTVQNGSPLHTEYYSSTCKHS